MRKNDITFISVMLATYKRYIRNEYRDGRLAKGQYYARINRMTDVANNIIKSLLSSKLILYNSCAKIKSDSR